MSAVEALKQAESEAIADIRRIQENLRLFHMRGPHKGMRRELRSIKCALSKAENRLRNLTEIKTGL